MKIRWYLVLSCESYTMLEIIYTGFGVECFANVHSKQETI